MWYEKQVIKILFSIAKIMARRGDKVYAHEIEELEKNIFNDERKEK